MQIIAVNKQRRQQMAARDQFHELHHHLADAGERNRADHDAGRGGGDADADHVAGAGDQTVDQIPRSAAQFVAHAAALAQHGQQRPLGEDDDAHADRGPERRQPRREALDDQAPHQHRDGQQVEQTGLCGWAECGQLVELLAVVQFGNSRGPSQQRAVDADQHRACDVGRRVRERRLDAARAVVDRQPQYAQQQHQERRRRQLAGQRGAHGGLQAGHVGLARFQVYDVDERQIGDERRQQGMLDHFNVGDADVFDHQKRRRSHHRRRQLAVGGRRHFHRAGLGAGKAHFFHQRNREHAGGGDIGNRRAGDHSRCRRGNHRRLGRAAAQVAQAGKRHADEIVAGAGMFEQGAEQHEQEHEVRGYAQRDAEHALRGEPLMLRNLGETLALVGDHFRHPLAEQGVGEEHDGDDYQRRPKRPSRGFQQGENADQGDSDIDGGSVAGTAGELRVEREQVARRRGRDHRQRDVRQWHAIPRRALARRKNEEGEEYREAEVDGPRFGVVEDAERKAQQFACEKRCRRGNP